MLNYYAVLGVGPAASGEEIKSAYRACVRQVHPDRQGAAGAFHAVQEAYETLRDPKRRAAYDGERQRWMASIGAVGCAGCGHANRITRQPKADEQVRCRHCKQALRLTAETLRATQRQGLSHEAERFVEEVGGELAELATDAVREGISRLRLRLGLSSRNKQTGG